MEIRDRIKELRKVRASELLPNPKNWRKHPDAQANALRGALSEIGYADALIAYETPNGLMLIDGHLRAETTPDQEVPVLVTDLTEDEADTLLATLDPLATMALRDADKLNQLLETIQTDNLAVLELLNAIGGDALGKLNEDFPSLPGEIDESVGDHIELCICECGHEHHKTKK